MTEARSIFEDATDEERHYFQLIDKKIQAREDEIISNGRTAHAVYLLFKFFENAQKSIEICCGSLAKELEGVRVYADNTLAIAAINFLQKEDSELSILVVDGIDGAEAGGALNHPFLAAINRADNIKGKATVAKLSEEAYKSFPYHFLVMDKSAVRIETDPKKVQAYVNFGDKPFGMSLAQIFSEFKAASSPLIELPKPA